MTPNPKPSSPGPNPNPVPHPNPCPQFCPLTLPPPPQEASDPIPQTPQSHPKTPNLPLQPPSPPLHPCPPSTAAAPSPTAALCLLLPSCFIPSQPPPFGIWGQTGGGGRVGVVGPTVGTAPHPKMQRRVLGMGTASGRRGAGIPPPPPAPPTHPQHGVWDSWQRFGAGGGEGWGAGLGLGDRVRG